MIWRWILGGLGAALAAGGTWLYQAMQPPPSVTVASWGDAYGRAQTAAMFHPYTDETGVNVRVVYYSGGIGELSSQAQRGQTEWDVVDFEIADAAEACRAGLLEPIDAATLPPGAGGVAAAQDFVPGAIGPCWAASVAFSQMFAYAPARFQGNAPSRIEDFFDVARFPGPRGLRDGPRYNLEMALMADGVPPDQVYAVLATRDGADRAFTKLDSMRGSIVWWRRLAEPMDMLTRGQVVMTTALNGRVFDAMSKDREAVAALWDGQVYEFDVFAIPKGSANKERARQFVAFATGTRPLAEMANRLPYGPARRSSLPFVGVNPETGEPMRSFLPTAPENFARALPFDPDWWAAQGALLEARWNAWRGE